MTNYIKDVLKWQPLHWSVVDSNALSSERVQRIMNLADAYAGSRGNSLTTYDDVKAARDALLAELTGEKK